MSALVGAVAAAGPLAAGWGAHTVWMRRRLDRARRDPLTGLHTRAAFEKAASRLLVSGPAAVLVVDLDGFKAVNDEHGHAAGDVTLQHSAARMSRWLTLVSPGSGIVARLGGDEFALVLPHPPDPLQPELSTLHTGLLVSFAYEERWLSVGASIGAAVATPAESCTAVLRRADEAMYAAKQTRTGIRVHDPADACESFAGRRAGRAGTHAS